MKKYYTLVQPFMQEGKCLSEYLSEQGIRFRIGADFGSELPSLPEVMITTDVDPLFKKYVVLLNEEDLSAIKLSVENFAIVGNRPFLNLKNRIREYFSWFL